MINIGLLGASRVAVEAIIDAHHQCDDVAVVAVGASSLERARDYAQLHGIKNAHANYEALIADSSVDLVYIGLPPGQHCHWSIVALNTGKHVLCEKPFALSVEEARSVSSKLLLPGSLAKSRLSKRTSMSVCAKPIANSGINGHRAAEH